VSAAGPTVPSGQVDSGAPAFSARTFGFGILEKVGSMSMDQAKKLAAASSDLEVEDGLLKKFEKSDIISYGKAGTFMGYVYVVVDGDDAVATAVVGKAAKFAMENGGTHLFPVHEGKDGKHLKGTAWGVGIGGQASVASSNGDSVIAPSTSLGYGKADSMNQNLPEGVYEVYCANPRSKPKRVSSYTYEDNTLYGQK